MNNIKGEGQEIHPKVCIVILNWNGLEDTVECLESLKRITYPNYEIILVDNGSEGNDVEVLRERFGDHIHIIENDKNYGFAEGCNIGMRYALETSTTDYILLLNNDTVIDPDFLSELVDVADSNAMIGIVGPKIYYYHEPTMIQSAGGQINWWTGKMTLIGCGQNDRGQFDTMKDVDWLLGCAILIRRRTLEDIGLLFAGYFAYFEETDWCVKCTKAGYRVVYLPDAKVWHKRPPSISKTDNSRLYYVTRNRFFFMKRNSTRLQFLSSFLYFFLRDFFSIPAMLIIRHKDIKLLREFYKGTCDGIKLAFRT